MNISISTVKKAIKLYSHPHVDKELARINIRKYLQALCYLGKRHILATPVQRLSQPRSH